MLKTRTKTILVEKVKEGYSPIEIRFDLDDLLGYQDFLKLLSLLDESERDHVELSCKYSKQFCGIDKNGNYINKTKAYYSFKFYGDDKIVNNILKFLQKIYPDYFLGLEEVK